MYWKSWSRCTLKDLKHTLYYGLCSLKGTKTMKERSQYQSNCSYVQQTIRHSKKSKYIYSNQACFENRLMITLIYAKSLFKQEDYIKAFTLLQLEYSKAPHYTSLLYLYGKYSVLSKQMEFYGSAIGALEESLRSCLSSRH